MPASSMCSWIPPMKMSRTSAQRVRERKREVDRRLPPELKDHPVRFLLLDDVQDVLEQEGLEVQSGGDVEVGGDRLRVVVRDDGGDALFPQCEDALDAAIVEFDPLADPNGATTDDQDFPSSQRRRLAGRLVRRIEVGRPRLKFAAARVDHLVRRPRSTPTDPLL